jgi:predicted DNA-binding antitoxin AbrB/MazE fold protein
MSVTSPGAVTEAGGRQRARKTRYNCYNQVAQESAASRAAAKGKEDMGSTIRARFSHGTLMPLEAVELREGDEVTITIVSSRPESGGDWLDRTAGGWAGLVDADELKREIYDSRLIATRTEPRL